MELENVKELKDTLKEFHDVLLQDVQQDTEYAGEADELIATMKRVLEKLKEVDDEDQLKSLIGEFGWDFLHVMMSVQELIAIDEELDLDLEEMELATD